MNDSSSDDEMEILALFHYTRRKRRRLWVTQGVPISRIPLGYTVITPGYFDFFDESTNCVLLNMIKFIEIIIIYFPPPCRRIKTHI